MTCILLLTWRAPSSHDRDIWGGGAAGFAVTYTQEIVLYLEHCFFQTVPASAEREKYEQQQQQRRREHVQNLAGTLYPTSTRTTMQINIPSRQHQFQACILLLIWHASSSSYVKHQPCVLPRTRTPTQNAQLLSTKPRTRRKRERERLRKRRWRLRLRGPALLLVFPDHFLRRVPPPHMACILLLIWHASFSSSNEMHPPPQTTCILLLTWHASSSSYDNIPCRQQQSPQTQRMTCILLLICHSSSSSNTTDADDEGRFKVWITSHELRPRTPITATTHWRLKVWIASHGFRPILHRCLGFNF